MTTAPAPMRSPPPPLGRIAFVFTSGRKVRLESSSETPSELFYSYSELKAWGWDVDLLEESDLATAHRSLAGRATSRVLPKPCDMSPTRVAAIAASGAIDRLNRYDAIVSTNQQLGTELSAFASLGLLKKPLVMLAMGLLPLGSRGAARALGLRSLLRKTTVVAISRGEQGHLKRRLGAKIDVRYVPFGVDHHFWRPRRPGSGGYVLSVGNDQHRDFSLLVRAWRPEWPALRIITRLKVVEAAPNVEVVRGHYNQHVLTDAEMRTHVQGALFTVVPVRETWQPSGQSAALQAMACGIPLVISDTPGLWDRDVMRDNVSCLLVRAGSHEAMTDAIQRLVDSSSLRSQLGAAARAAVEQHFTADLMAADLAKVIAERIS